MKWFTPLLGVAPKTPVRAAATVSPMNRDEMTVHPIRIDEANRFNSRNHTSALNEARRSHRGNSARSMTLYLTFFLPGRRLKRRNVIAMQRAHSSDAMEKLEPIDRNRPAKLPTRQLTRRPAR